MFHLLLLLSIINTSRQHGYLAWPPNRSSLWRYGYETPKNYNDNSLYCGGLQALDDANGKCGPCGDPYYGPREHEAGGLYASGIITEQYPVDTKIIKVHIILTVNHQGYFEFRLCPNNNVHKPVTSQCLNRFLLPIQESSVKYQRNRYYPKDTDGPNYNLTLEIPRGIICSQCVLQWRYHTGNSWGVEPNGTGCMGCGLQEEFYNCADISIGMVPSSKSMNSGSRPQKTLTESLRHNATESRATKPSNQYLQSIRTESKHAKMTIDKTLNRHLNSASPNSDVVPSKDSFSQLLSLKKRLLNLISQKLTMPQQQPDGFGMYASRDQLLSSPTSSLLSMPNEQKPVLAPVPEVRDLSSNTLERTQSVINHPASQTNTLDFSIPSLELETTNSLMKHGFNEAEYNRILKSQRLGTWPADAGVQSSEVIKVVGAQSDITGTQLSKKIPRIRPLSNDQYRHSIISKISETSPRGIDMVDSSMTNMIHPDSVGQGFTSILPYINTHPATDIRNLNNKVPNNGRDGASVWTTLNNMNFMDIINPENIGQYEITNGAGLSSFSNQNTLPVFSNDKVPVVHQNVPVVQQNIPVSQHHEPDLPKDAGVLHQMPLPHLKVPVLQQNPTNILNKDLISTELLTKQAPQAVETNFPEKEIFNAGHNYRNTAISSVDNSTQINSRMNQVHNRLKILLYSTKSPSTTTSLPNSFISVVSTTQLPLVSTAILDRTTSVVKNIQRYSASTPGILSQGSTSNSAGTITYPTQTRPKDVFSLKNQFIVMRNAQKGMSIQPIQQKTVQDLLVSPNYVVRKRKIRLPKSMVQKMSPQEIMAYIRKKLSDVKKVLMVRK